ncbi:MAG: DsbA family protein, partial [bacterium]
GAIARRGSQGLCIALAVISLAGPTAASDIGMDGAIGGQNEGRTPLAELDDEILYVEDVEGALALRIYQLRLDLYSLLESEARRWMDEKLLEDAARARGLTVAELEALLAKETSEVDEAEIDRYLAEHPAGGRVDPAQARERVRLYLAETRRLQTRIDFMESLREAAGARVLLDPPQPPRSEVDLAGVPTRGPEDAPVVIVHFASFGSRSSARSAAKLRRLEEAFPGEIRRAHRHLLNERDELGLLAARIAFAAEEIGRFWPLHDALFEALERDGFLTPERIREIARESGVPGDRIDAAVRDPARIAQVKRDIEAANASGIPREPSLFINGLFASGLSPYDDLHQIVAREAREAGRGDEPSMDAQSPAD